MWFLGALPILLGFVCLNLGILAWVYRARLSGGQWPVARFTWLVPALWVLAVYIDFASLKR